MSNRIEKHINQVVHDAVGLFLTKNAKRLKPLILKHMGERIPLKDIEKALNSLDVVKRLDNIIRLKRQHAALFPNHKWYIDLIDLKSGRFLPRGFLFTILDYYSRKAWGFYLKNKRADTVYKAFAPLYNKYKPLIIIGDKGSEWSKIKKLKSFFYLTTTKGSTAPIESFNRTILMKLKLLFSLESKTGWKKKLNSVLTAYNETPHSSTNQTPNDMFELKEFNIKPVVQQHWKLKPGDPVRKQLKYNIFAKKARQNKLGKLLHVEKKVGQQRWLLSDGRTYTSGQIQPAKGQKAPHITKKKPKVKDKVKDKTRNKAPRTTKVKPTTRRSTRKRKPSSKAINNPIVQRILRV